MPCARARTGPRTPAAVLGAGPGGLGWVIGLKRAGVRDGVVPDRAAQRLPRPQFPQALALALVLAAIRSTRPSCW